MFKKMLLVSLLLGLVVGFSIKGYSGYGIDAIVSTADGRVTTANPLPCTGTQYLGDKSYSDTSHSGTGAKTTLFWTEYDTTVASGIYVYSFGVACDNTVDSGYAQVTNGATERVILWSAARANESPPLDVFPAPVDFSGTVTITASSGIKVFIQYIDY